jgi:hypothetical protein
MSNKFRSHVPHEFICPISMYVMHNPVIGPDGNTYERSAISKWLEHNVASLETRQQMLDNLIPNIALQNIIQASEYKRAHPPTESAQRAPVAQIDEANRLRTLSNPIYIDVVKKLASYKYIPPNGYSSNLYSYNADGTINRCNADGTNKLDHFSKKVGIW